LVQAVKQVAAFLAHPVCYVFMSSVCLSLFLLVYKFFMGHVA